MSFENAQKATTISEALNGLKFSIPVTSLITNDTIRDAKLKKFFFGTLKNTDAIIGEIKMTDEKSGTVNIMMNGITKKLPINCIINQQMVTIKATIDLNNWQAQIAIEALNNVCLDLHKGPDGISKTWTDVKIEVQTILNYK